MLHWILKISGYLEFSFSSTGINDILKYFNIENILNYNNITVFTLILNNKCSHGEHTRPYKT